MFCFPFGWRKASKCKKLILHVQCRLKFLKIKKSSIAKRIREDIVELLINGKPEAAFSRAEELLKDQSLLSAYDMLEHFCETFILHLPYIRKQKDYSDEIKEAVSTLIFAASWCGDVPELQIIQKLFRQRHGSKFIKAITELHPGNHVNSQVKAKLCLKYVPYNMKQSLIVEIAKDHALQQQLPLSNKKSLASNLLLVCGNETFHNWDTQCNRTTFNVDDEVEEIHINNNNNNNNNTLQDSYAVDKTMFLFTSTLPSERNNCGYNLQSGPCNRFRSSKCIINVSSPSKHVHPKLPDYDELVAKFKALKQQYQQSDVSTATLS